MKKLLLVIRWFVGLLFIFSGLIKANDPSGLSYKMQEFFEAWNLHGFNDFTLPVALAMNVFEVLAGVAVIIGWRMKLFSWLLLLLIVFFSFLTGYAVFSGKITTCGCFGDCLPLTAMQSFIKDIILMLLIVVLFAFRNKISPQVNPVIALTLLSISVIGTVYFQRHVLIHLPVVDCLPYKQGNDLLQQMEIPKDAVRDSVEMTFQYKKDGKIIEYNQNNLPDNLDSTYEFIDRFDKIIRKGNAVAPISDFALESPSGNDTTAAILNQHSYYILLMAKDFTNITEWNNESLKKLLQLVEGKNIPVFIVTADKENAGKQSALPAVSGMLFSDATVLKTAARVNATYFLMKKATVISKYSYVDTEKLIDELRIEMGNGY